MEKSLIAELKELAHKAAKETYLEEHFREMDHDTAVEKGLGILLTMASGKDVKLALRIVIDTLTDFGLHTEANTVSEILAEV